MKIKTDFKVGQVGYTLDIDEGDPMKALHIAITLSNPRRKCDVCGNYERFKLDSNKDKEGNTYVNNVCLGTGCGAKSKLGQYKTGGYFWHKFEQWQPKQTQQTQSNDGWD